MFLETPVPIGTRIGTFDFLRYGRRQSNCCISWLNSQSFKRFFSPSWLLQQKTMITLENRTSLQANYPFRYVETSTIPSDRSGIFVLRFRKARQRTVNRTGSKMKCVDLCNFHFCCAFIFLSANEKIRIFWCVQSYSSTTF